MEALGQVNGVQDGQLLLVGGAEDGGEGVREGVVRQARDEPLRRKRRKRRRRRRERRRRRKRRRRRRRRRRRKRRRREE